MVLHKVFGYGTFITKKLYRNRRNVKSAFLPRYFRISKHSDLYPYILKDKGQYPDRKSGFWGLTFDVNDRELQDLDNYELLGTLYDRILESCLFTDGTKKPVSLYYPTQAIINKYELNQLIPLGDLWQKRIVEKFPEIIQEFPELSLSVFKLND